MALQLFCESCASSEAEVRASAAAAGGALSSARAALSSYVQLFAATAAAAATAGERHATLQQCRATLERAALVEQQLAARVEQGRLAAAAALSEARALAEEAACCLQECQAWQRQHQGLISGLVSSPLPALTAPPGEWDPAAAAVPLGMSICLSKGSCREGSHTQELGLVHRRRPTYCCCCNFILNRAGDGVRGRGGDASGSGVAGEARGRARGAQPPAGRLRRR